MRIILYTNVFVSGIFFSGPPYEILKGWRDGKLQLAVTPEILDEYRRVGEALAVRYRDIDLGAMIELVTVKAAMFSAQALPEPVCNDSDDDKFIACALASRSKIIVSGDAHLLKVNDFHGISVLKPRQYVDKYFHRTDKSQKIPA